MDKKSKIYVSSHLTLSGSSIVRILKKIGYKRIITRTPKELDLLNQKAVSDFFKKEKPEYVFMPSYKSGSIAANVKYPSEFIYENLMTQNNIIHSAYLTGVKKLLTIGASCVYPKNTPQPIKEEYLLTSELEKTSEPYSIAKISEIIMCQAYNKQYNTKFISVIPATLYGPGDAFDLEKSHVLSAMLRKFHEAKIKGETEITLWGSGKPKREFIYVDDFTESCIFLMNKNCEFDLINVGVGKDLSIKELANLVKKIIGFNGAIKWDTSKPDGAMRKLLDSKKIKLLGWKPKTKLKEGIKKTYEWFKGVIANNTNFNE